MGYERIEGIVLHAFPYGEKARIIKIFSKTRGLVSIIVRGLSPKKTHLFSLTSPLTHAVFHVSNHRSEDLFTLKEASIIEDHFSLRQQAHHLGAAIDILQAILTSQLHHKTSSNLFSLLQGYLEKISLFKNPSTLSSSLMLKVLLHDGLLHLQTTCNSCQNTTTAISHGESFCQTHAPSYRENFSIEEIKLLMVLANARSFNELQTIEVPSKIREKIKKLFRQLQHQ